MKKYAKFIEDEIHFITRVPYCSAPNPRADMLAAYAENHGYKEYIATDKPPCRYYTLQLKETAKRITEKWVAMPLDDAKALALDTVQHDLDLALATRAVIPCGGFEAGIVYDEAAILNAMGMAAGDGYIDAQDGLHELTTADVDEIKAALKQYRLGIYQAATAKRAAIAAATSVEEVEAALA